jgi:2-polyprenyl-6-methoxyphenol hydroxylase-like FAD-dependent oxidoreductase
VVQLAIVGGGPGGLIMTHLLERFPVGLFDVTLFEATARLGGKILTQRFDTIPAIYEAGVAELYDYSHIGLDPLKTLVQELGLKAIPMHGYAVVLGEETLPMVAVTTAELSQSTTPSKRWPTSWPTP